MMIYSFVNLLVSENMSSYTSIRAGQVCGARDVASSGDIYMMIANSPEQALLLCIVATAFVAHLPCMSQ